MHKTPAIVEFRDSWMYAALPLHERLFLCSKPMMPRSQWSNLTTTPRPVLQTYDVYIFCLLCMIFFLTPPLVLESARNKTSHQGPDSTCSCYQLMSNLVIGRPNSYSHWLKFCLPTPFMISFIRLFIIY